MFEKSRVLKSATEMNSEMHRLGFKIAKPIAGDAFYYLLLKHETKTSRVLEGDVMNLLRTRAKQIHGPQVDVARLKDSFLVTFYQKPSKIH